MTATTMVDRRQGRRRPRSVPIIFNSNALAFFTMCVLGSHSAAADPMMPSKHLKKNHLVMSASNKPFKKTHAERMAYRTNKWKEYHSGSYPGAPPADYGGQHPFEVMAAAEAGARKEQQTSANSDTTTTTTTTKRPQLRSRGLLQGGTYPDTWYGESWSLDADPADWYPTGTDADNRHNFENYKPIRIGLNFDNLPSDSASSDKNRFVENEVMRVAQQFWTKALNVYPAKNIRVDPEYCEDLPPPTHKSEGVDDTDLMLYIYAEKFCGGGQMAAAAGCSWDQFNRPVAGIVRFCYDSINLQSDGTADETTIMTNVETAIHEVSWSACVLHSKPHIVRIF